MEDENYHNSVHMGIGGNAGTGKLITYTELKTIRKCIQRKMERFNYAGEQTERRLFIRN